MANAGELIIDDRLVKQIERVDKALEKINKTMDITTPNINELFDAFRNQEGGGTLVGLDLNDFVKKLKEIQKTMDAVGANSKRGFKTMANAANKASTELDRIIDRLTKYHNVSYTSAMSFSRGAKTLGDEKQAIEYLIKARENLKTTTSTYENRLRMLNDAIEQHKEKLKQAALSTKQLEEAQRHQYAGAVNFSQNTNTLGDERKAVEYLTKARENLSKTDAEYSAKVLELNDRIAQHTENIKRASLSTKDLEAAQRKTYSVAIQFSSNAKTIGEEKQAVEYLIKARENLSRTDSNYYAKLSELNARIRQHKQHIAEASGEVDKFKSENKNLSLSFDGIAAKLGVIFGIDRISAYVGKVVEVTKEFERQKVALDAIIRDQDASHTIWNQTVQLALKSPFQLKELVTYTKQLAAYRIETEKLHDTTKRLADVSAGLGVDMSRLILAYGQIRAATYLRGTELRQLTEAGIPMLEELATYFTELEGRAISAGDVFEMISKRMVTFKDVEEVFKRMTDEGGVFFDMQEKQSQTLYGTISNLKDAYDIMLNEIGQSNYGFTKTFLSFLKDAATNWREWQFRLIALIPLLSGVRLAQIAETKAIKDFGTITLWGNSAIKQKFGATLKDISTMTLQKATTEGLTTAQYAFAKATLYVQSVVKGLWSLLKSAAPFLAIAAIIEIVRVMTRAKREAEELRKELTKIAVEESANVNRSAKAYKDLVARLSLANKGSLERKQIISQLNSQYGEYLGYLVDENTSVEKLANSYDVVLERIKNMRKYKAYEKALETIDSKFADKISSATDNFTETLKKGVIGRDDYLHGKGGNTTKVFNAIIPTEKEINDLLGIIREEVGKMDEESLNSTAKQTELLKNIIERYYGKGVVIRQSMLSELSGSMTGVVDIYSKLIKEEKKAEKLLNTSMGETPLNNQKLRNEEDKIKNKYAIERKKIEHEITSEYEKRKSLNDLEIKEQTELINMRKNFGLIDEATAQKQIKKLVDWQTKTTESINNKIKASLGSMFDEETLSRVLIDKEMQDSKSLSEYEKDIKTNWENNKALLDDLNRRRSQGVYIADEEIKKAETLEELYRRTAELFDIKLEDSNGKGGSSKENKILSDRIKLIKQMNEEYTKLRKKLSKEDAEKQVIESFKDTFRDAFKGTDISLTSFIIDNDAMNKMRESGQKVGHELSQGVLDELERLKKDGVYIRNFDEEFVKTIKEREGFKAKVYKDKGGKATQGYGETIDIENGKAWTEQKADMVLRNSLNNRYVSQLNEILDMNKDLVLTQKQYNALLDLTYQGGSRVVEKLLERAKNTELGVKEIERIRGLFDTTFQGQIENPFGDEFIANFRNAENIYERISMLLKTANLTINGGIDKDWYKGMQERSNIRSSMFSGDLQITKQIRGIFKEISTYDFTTLNGVISQLEKLAPIAKKEGQKAELELSKAISEVQVLIGLDVKEKDDDAVKAKINKWFDNYDITLKVKDLNIPTDMAERLFGFEAIDLEGLRKKLTESKDLFVGTDMEKEYEKFLGKLDDLENKHIKELVEKYSKYLVQSYSDLGKIRINEMQEIQEIMSMKNIGDKERQLMLKGVQEKTQKEIDKNAWESFKSSAMYEQLFTDIEKLGTRSIKNLIKKLGDMKDALKTLPPEVYKEIQGQITKLEETINERNPYESFFKNLSEISKLNKTKETTDEGVTLMGEDALNYRLMKQQEEIEKTKELISLYEQLRESNGDVSQVKGNTSLLPQEDFSSKTREDWDAIINSLKESLELQEKNAEETGKNADKYAKTRQNIGKVKENINEWAEASIKVLDGMDSILDAFGVAEDSSARLWISNIKNIITMTQNIFTLGLAFVALGVEINSALGVIGIIATALSAIATLFSSLFGMKDKRIEKKIKKQEELVQSLEKQYKKLEKQIKQTYDLNTFDMANKQAKENIEEQIKAREEQIRLEQAKKKTDKDKIKEYQEDIEELQEQLQELEEERIQAVGGFGSEESYKEAASEFVSAWLDAYKETGQGLDGLNDKFDEFFMKMIEKQLLYRGVNNYLDGFYKEFDAMFDDNTVTKEELANIREMWANTAPELNDFMEGLVESLGIASLLKGSTGDMEGLQKGIQGVTEETAQIIEGYLNSIRFLVSEKKDMLRDFLNEFKNPNVENPIVSTLKIIAQQTSAINSLLSGILAPHNTLGGQGLKVVI